MMNIGLWHQFLLLIFGVIFALSSVCPAVAQPAPAPNPADMDISANLIKDTVEVGEPVVIQITVRNMGDRPLLYTSSMSALGDIKITINRPRRLPHEFMGVEVSGVAPDVTSKLKPGDARFFYLPILYDRESPTGYLFTEPQTVTIDLQFRFSVTGGIKDQRWKSPPLTVEIIPTSEASRAAHEMLLNIDCAIALQNLALNDKTLQPFRKALEVTPRESALHPYLLASLARAYGLSRRQDLDTMLGLDFANQLSTLHPASHLADDALMLQATIQDQIGMEQEARHTLVQLYNTYHTSEYISEGNPLFMKYFNMQPDLDNIDISADPTWMFRH